jgi:hypothetical protein
MPVPFAHLTTPIPRPPSARYAVMFRARPEAYTLFVLDLKHGEPEPGDKVLLYAPASDVTYAHQSARFYFELVLDQAGDTPVSFRPYIHPV